MREPLFIASLASGLLMFCGMFAFTYGQSTPNVNINGHQLSTAEVNAMQLTYGQAPQPGQYWYDPVSGMYGAKGFPAYGFMYPGHAFGPLSPDCSEGTTGVFVNGRELPENEWLGWSQILGGYLQAGRYWFDSYGNIGLEGQLFAQANLYAAAQQQAAQIQYDQGGGHHNYSGGGAAQSQGDNFWSTRFSAGNSSADGSQGYVSVPGYGPVGYGF